MYLVDTSVLVDYLREKENAAVQYFIQIMNDRIPFGITSLIYQEILQGAASKKDLKILIEFLESQRFFYPKDAKKSYQQAAELYIQCRSKGLTIRSTIDCLIAQVSIEHELILLHNDKDFTNMKKAVPELKLVDL